MNDARERLESILSVLVQALLKKEQQLREISDSVTLSVQLRLAQS